MQRRRAELGLTQQQVAVRADVSVSALREMEHGRRESPYRVRDVLRVLGLQDDSEERRIADSLMAELPHLTRAEATAIAKVVLKMGPLPRPPAEPSGRDERAAG